MTRTNTITIATTSRMWISPPTVYEDTMPSSQGPVGLPQLS
jgi:hypothetical protein